jgi:tetratricopeptide (TPR) repeat protein
LRYAAGHAEYSPDGRWIGILLTESVSLVKDTNHHETRFITLLLDAADGRVKFSGKTVRYIRHDLENRSVKAPKIGFAADGTFLTAHYSFAKGGPAYSGHWDVEDVAAEKVLYSTPVGVDHDFQFVPGGTLALVASRDGGYLEALDLASRSRLWRVDATPDDVGQSRAAFSSDGRRFLTCDAPLRAFFPMLLSGIIRQATIRETETGRKISTLTLPSIANVGSLEFTPDGHRVLASSTNLTHQFATVYDADSDRALLDLDVIERSAVIEKGVFAPDGRYISQDWGPHRGGTGSQLRVWDGRATTAVWTAERTIDDLLAEARRLCDDPEAANRNPAKATALTAQAVAAYPADYECLGAHGLVLILAGKDEEALSVLVRQKEAGPYHPPLLLAANDYLLAVAQFRLGQAAEARAIFDAAEENMGKPVKLPNIRANTASVSTPYPDAAQRPRAERHRALAIAALGIKDKPAPLLVVDAPKLFEEKDHPSDRLNRAQFVLTWRNKDYATAVKIADEALTQSSDAFTRYNAACIFARAAGVVPDEATKTLYADRAMEILRQGIDAGFIEIHDRNRGERETETAYDLLRRDDDLDPLRGRADFQKLMA